MGKVLEFTFGKCTMTGPVVCTACHHQWEATAPVGTPSFECPACASMKGVLMRHVRYEEPTWLCARCQGGLFSVILLEDTPSLACAGCGEVSAALDIFPER